MDPPVSRQLLLDVDEAIERYRNAVYVSERERIEKLQRVIEQTDQLHRTLAALDGRTRHTIVAPVARSRHAVDPLILVPQLKMLQRQAEHAKRHAAAPRRGPQRKDPLRQLVVDIGIAWQIEYPRVKGITASKGERRGPMLEFISHELKCAKITIRSEAALGKMLYSVRARISERAEAERRKQLVTRKVGSVTVVSLE